MRPRIGIVAAQSPSGEQGGAERFFTGLRDALENVGLDTEIVGVYSDEANFDCIMESYLRFYDLDLNRFDGIISSKAPSYVARHPNHVCYLQHTMRVFYDMFNITGHRPSPESLEQRQLIHSLDSAALKPPRTRRVFAIGEEVAARLRRYNGFDAEVIRHPTSLRGLRQGSFKYLFLPGRLHQWKRVDLAIKAMRYVKAPIELVISGIGEDAERLQGLAKGDPRIRFVGRVPDEELVTLYADALAVLFMPRLEDLGLITLEAFESGKPVITCTDSGEPARLVRDGETGFICLPKPRDIADRIEQLAQNPARAAAMGKQGAASIVSITWDGVAMALAAALGFGHAVGLEAVAQ